MRRISSRALARVALFALWSGALAAGNLPPQTSEQSGITVKVTPGNLAGPVWEFTLVFDTHSGELKDDPARNAVLVVDGGAPIAPAGWEGDAPGGHHRKGVLRFKPAAASPASVELRLQRASETKPRVFRWQLR